MEGLVERQRVRRNDPLRLVLGEVRSRLGYLNEVGLGYLTLDRPTRTLSGGETERVNLTTCLGTRLVNTLFVLDEPSVGLHPRDTERLVRLLEQLRTAGNTVVVVEHEASVIRAADQIIDLGPGHGATGGEVVFPGDLRAAPGFRKIAYGPVSERAAGRSRCPRDGRSGQGRGIAGPGRRKRGAKRAKEDRRDAGATFRLAHATRNNLQDLSVEIPLGRFVCVTGVSGSGKTTLVREVLLPALSARLHSAAPQTKASDRLTSDNNGDAQEDDARVWQSAFCGA